MPSLTRLLGVHMCKIKGHSAAVIYNIGHHPFSFLLFVRFPQGPHFGARHISGDGDGLSAGVQPRELGEPSCGVPRPGIYIIMLYSTTGPFGHAKASCGLNNIPGTRLSCNILGYSVIYWVKM